jgi:hypothetical protein
MSHTDNSREIKTGYTMFDDREFWEIFFSTIPVRARAKIAKCKKIEKK